jgi:hypothetical protein
MTALAIGVGAGTELRVSELIAVAFMLGPDATLELVVSAALVVEVVEIGARAGARSPAHAVPIDAVATASTTVIAGAAGAGMRRMGTGPPVTSACMPRTRRVRSLTERR